MGWRKGKRARGERKKDPEERHPFDRVFTNPVDTRESRVIPENVRGEKRASREGGPGAIALKGPSRSLSEKKWRVAPPASPHSRA